MEWSCLRYFLCVSQLKLMIIMVIIHTYLHPIGERIAMRIAIMTIILSIEFTISKIKRFLFIFHILTN
jgi:hypothetical protein